MAEQREVQDRIERAVFKAQDEILRASHKLSREVTLEAERLVPPFGRDLTRLVDGIFDFAQHVVENQRKLVEDVLKTIEEAMPEVRAPKGRTRPVTRRRPTKTAKATAAKATAAKTTTAGTPAVKARKAPATKRAPRVRKAA